MVHDVWVDVWAHFYPPKKWRAGYGRAEIFFFVGKERVFVGCCEQGELWVQT